FKTGNGTMRDWLIRPAAYALLVATVVVVVTFHSGYSACSNEVAPPWYARITPWHALVTEWMVLGLMVVELGRRFLTLGVNAEREPGPAEGRAERMAARAARPGRVLVFTGFLIIGSFVAHGITRYDSKETCEPIAEESFTSTDGRIVIPHLLAKAPADSAL